MCVPEPRLSATACLLRAKGALVVSGALSTSRVSGLHVGQFVEASDSTKPHSTTRHRQGGAALAAAGAVGADTTVAAGAPPGTS